MAFISTTATTIRRHQSFLPPSLCQKSRPFARSSSFHNTTRSRSTFPSAPKMTAASSETTTSLPARVVLDPLPTLYVYDHCPFCVRVRHALGTKNIKYRLVWLMNDDVSTPSSLIGKKMVPIFVPPSNEAMGESMDIIKMIDSDETYGTPGLIKPMSDRKDIDDWLSDLADPMRRLTRIRFSRALLPEFTFEDAREAYIRNHPLQNPESYDENYANSSTYIESVQQRMGEMNDMIYSKEFCTEGGFSYDDINLFPRLRSLTMVKGLELPDKVKAYVEYQAERAEVPLYYNYAL